MMTVKAGWYRRKSDAIRYWDGEAWTDHVYKGPVEETEAPEAETKGEEAPLETPVADTPADYTLTPDPPTSSETNGEQQVPWPPVFAKGSDIKSDLRSPKTKTEEATATVKDAPKGKKGSKKVNKVLMILAIIILGLALVGGVVGTFMFNSPQQAAPTGAVSVSNLAVVGVDSEYNSFSSPLNGALTL